VLNTSQATMLVVCAPVLQVGLCCWHCRFEVINYIFAVAITAHPSELSRKSVYSTVSIEAGPVAKTEQQVRVKTRTTQAAQSTLRMRNNYHGQDCTLRLHLGQIAIVFFSNA
jgi:hypothetical protein